MSSVILAVVGPPTGRYMLPPVGRCCQIPVIVLHRHTSSDQRLNKIEFVSLPIIFSHTKYKTSEIDLSY